MNRLSLRQKQNQSFTVMQPRQSLKKTMTSKKKPQKNQARMSMLPLKRQRMSVNIESQLASSRPSISALSQNNNHLNTISHMMNHSFYNNGRKSISKQTIITNLVNKLDEKQEIRSIIETKLNRNSYGGKKQFVYTSDFQPFASNVSLQNGARDLNSTQSMRKSVIQKCYETTTEQQNNSQVHLKLQECQQELAYFKSIVCNLQKKVRRLEGDTQRNFSIVKDNDDYKTCSNCKCHQQRKTLKKVSDAQTQTFKHKQELNTKQQQDSYQSDFFDNLQKTLKVLDRAKVL